MPRLLELKNSHMVKFAMFNSIEGQSLACPCVACRQMLLTTCTEVCVVELVCVIAYLGMCHFHAAVSAVINTIFCIEFFDFLSRLLPDVINIILGRISTRII